MFYFNAERYDFWPIYESIKKYYPMGIMKDEGELFFQYPGFKNLEDILVDNIHNEVHYQTRWMTFEGHLQSLIKKPVVGTTYGQAPSFSAYVELEAARLMNHTLFQELYFAVSLIGPFYTVIGRDRCVVNLSEDRFAVATNYLTVSPEGEYKELFALVCSQIEQRFETYRFVPFDIAIQELEGLAVRYMDEPGNKLFYALFNQQIDLNAQVEGDRFYKYSDWSRGI